MSFKYGLIWIEPRLLITTTYELSNNPDQLSEIIPLQKSFINLLWIPDTYFHNLKNIKRHSVIQDSEALFLTGINKKSALLYSLELEVEINCPLMSFENYPIGNIIHIVM